MEENKSKKSVGVPLILVIFILVIALVACIGYIMKNNEQELAINNNNNEKTVNELKVEIDKLKNELVQKENETKVISINDEKSFNMEGEIIEFIQESDFSKSISVSYVVNGKNKGEIRINNNKERVHTQNIDKKVIDINSIDYAFEREIFILFEDGTVGKISVADIENKNYKINMLNNIENIVRIQELYFSHNAEGTDFVLVAIDKYGKIYTLDSVND